MPWCSQDAKPGLGGEDESGMVLMDWMKPFVLVLHIYRQPPDEAPQTRASTRLHPVSWLNNAKALVADIQPSSKEQSMTRQPSPHQTRLTGRTTGRLSGCSQLG